MTARCFALVPCAGVGSRAGAAGPKQYVPIAGQPMVLHTLEALLAVPRLSAVLVVLAPGDAQFKDIVRDRPIAAGADAHRSRLWSAPCGGDTRADTVRAGLDALLHRGAAPADWVLVHDAARCLVRPAWVDALIDACVDDPVGGLLAWPVADTLKDEAPPAASAPNGPARVARTMDRRGKWQAQTPQMFRIGALAQALDAALAADPAGITDEASAVEALGLSPRLVPGATENFKLTYPADFDLAERLLRTR